MSLDTDLLCREDERRALLLEHPTLNGIDYVEYDEFPALPAAQRYRLAITFLKAPPTGLTGADLAITGGVRNTGIQALPGPLTAAASPPEPPHTLFAQLDGSGDFSDYVVTVRHADLDQRLDHAPFSFKAGCPSELDCRVARPCEPEPLEEPRLDYLAKDFASFRRLMLDLARSRNPRWNEAAPAELGTTLVELLAYKGDLLSWSQDAVATEAFLETCRLRVSARRHARLVDYRMHDGRNAAGFVVLQAEDGSPGDGVVPTGTRFLTRLRRPLRGQPGTPGPVITSLAESAYDDDPALREALVFEATARTRVLPALNRLFVHEMGDAQCCLPKGARQAFLFGVDAGLEAYAPPLEVGDWLLIEEVKGVASGAAIDLDPARRQFVRLVEVQKTVPATPPAVPPPLTDPVFKRSVGGTAAEPVLQPVKAADGAAPRLPLVRVTWREADALTMPFCLSTTTSRGQSIAHVSIVRGNVVPVDHGRTVQVDPGDLPAELAGFARASTLRLELAPLTIEAPPGAGPRDAMDRPLAGRHELNSDARDCLPAVRLRLTLPGAPPAWWQAVPDLLGSGPFEEHFVAEIDNSGAATLRFGDGVHGRSAAGATSIEAHARIGNGALGNVGRDAIAHAVFIAPAAAPDSFPDLLAVRQPLAMAHGQEPETIREVRELAGAAMRAVQFRAVTEADWQERALAVPGVADARATFRWTGSWHTVFVALHPVEPADLVVLPGGRVRLARGFASRTRAALSRVRLAGYDLVLDTARYVPLQLTIRLCVATGHFRGQVLAAVAERLSNRRLADGRTGFFHVSRLRFGAAVRLSRIIALVQEVPGVASLEVREFHRYWELPNGELESGSLPLGPFEIARLDNDPSLPENGVLELDAVGGL
ncbi:MAG: hypothetical protein R3D25_04730 [Geminicoccaceae bacterium]